MIATIRVTTMALSIILIMHRTLVGIIVSFIMIEAWHMRNCMTIVKLKRSINVLLKKDIIRHNQH